VKPTTPKRLAVHSSWIVRTRTVLVRLIAVTLLTLGVAYGVEQSGWVPKGGSRGLGYTPNTAVLALFVVLAGRACWTRKPKLKNDFDPIVALLGQAPAIRLEALLADDPFDGREPLVVGTSLTYAQFLNRPTLRDVAQAQALPEIKIPEPANALDERSFFHEALFEQHLTEWINQGVTQDEASETNEQPKDGTALGQLGFEGTAGLSEQALRRATIIERVIDRAYRREMFGHGVFGPDDLDSEILSSELGNESNKPGCVDELLERWINDDADAPLPEFLELV
jgi:hypothetical protein